MIAQNQFMNKILLSIGDTCKNFLTTELVLAGPFIDNSGGQIIIKVDSEEEAINIMQNDSGVLKDIFIGELHPWHIVARNTEDRLLDNHRLHRI